MFKLPLLQLLATVPLVESMETWTKGPQFAIKYNKPIADAIGELQFNVKVPENQYLAIVFGESMIRTDAVVFRGINKGGELGIIDDVWLNGFPPRAEFVTVDSSNNYKPKFGSSFGKGNDKYGTYTFETSRALDTYDDKDFAFVCGTTYDFKWVGNSWTSDYLTKHNKSGSFKLVLKRDCSIGNSDYDNYKEIEAAEQAGALGLDGSTNI